MAVMMVKNDYVFKLLSLLVFIIFSSKVKGKND